MSEHFDQNRSIPHAQDHGSPTGWPWTTMGERDSLREAGHRLPLLPPYLMEALRYPGKFWERRARLRGLRDSSRGRYQSMYIFYTPKPRFRSHRKNTFLYSLVFFMVHLLHPPPSGPGKPVLGLRSTPWTPPGPGRARGVLRRQLALSLMMLADACSLLAIGSRPPPRAGPAVQQGPAPPRPERQGPAPNDRAWTAGCPARLSHGSQCDCLKCDSIGETAP